MKSATDVISESIRRLEEENKRLKADAEQRQEWNRTLSHEIGKLQGIIGAALAVMPDNPCALAAIKMREILRGEK